MNLNKTVVAGCMFLATCLSASADVSGEKYDWTVTGAPERPYIHDYSKSMLMKFYMSDPNREEQSTNIYMTYDQALENIKAIDRISRGIPKIVYLVGWQFNGHDDRYPDFSVMNEALKSSGDATALQSYHRLVEEARKYNTTVSVHVLLSDAYTNAPSWDEYVSKGYICRDAEGKFMSPGMLQGYPMYWVNLYNEWKGGDLQQRLDDLVEMLDIDKAGTIHFDAFLSNPSPYHGVTKEMQEETMRKVLRYMRDKGIDVTAELYVMHGREPMLGLQAAAWWNDLPAELRAKAGKLGAGGISGQLFHNQWPEIGFMFGDNAHAEDVFHLDLGWDAFIREFAIGTLPYMLYNSRSIENYDPDAMTVTYSGGLVADGRHRTLRENGRLLRQGDDLLIAPVWSSEKGLYAYSGEGYDGRQWELPKDWKGVKNIDIFTVTPDGDIPAGSIKAVNGKIILNVPAGKLLYLKPHK